jgi:ATP-dependent Clp protease ATP-binding subunit ClpB
MNLSQFTIKAQEAVAAAQQLAFNQHNQQIETPHLLQAMLSDENSSVPYLLKKNDVNVNFVEQKLTEMVKKIPTTTGEAGQVISREMNQTMLKAGSYLKDFGDEFISLEHLLMALLGNHDAVGNLLKDAGLTEKNLKASVKESRKGSTIQSQTAGENAVQSLKKFANNLNEMASHLTYSLS